MSIHPVAVHRGTILFTTTHLALPTNMKVTKERKDEFSKSLNNIIVLW